MKIFLNKGLIVSLYQWVVKYLLQCSFCYQDSALGGAGPNDVLCKTCSVLCVLEQMRLRVDNSSVRPLNQWPNWLKACPVRYNLLNCAPIRNPKLML